MQPEPAMVAIELSFLLCRPDGSAEAANTDPTLSSQDRVSLSEAFDNGLSHTLLSCGGATIVKLRGISRFLVIVQPPPEHPLSKRQREVAEYAAAGATAAEIARALGISVYTVRQHLKDVYRLLGVGNRVELARALGTSLT